ncbi:hypothetical protein ES332_D01G177500v1 [Gossypium tomentosum]|uniref:Uncharacterized protein n=1 Tax=Gossypium tomentosum TaxID=34277 RepID=A0A5D2MAA6_GOSTO|nr:hypothetical protein ES332_D01G177500v1 [Gossypium tomentosum]
MCCVIRQSSDIGKANRLPQRSIENPTHCQRLLPVRKLTPPP